MKFFPLAFIGKPFQTLTEQKRAAWAGLPPKYRITQPVETRKQWRPVERFKRKAS
jgi:hypothetical protein